MPLHQVHFFSTLYDVGLCEFSFDTPTFLRARAYTHRAMGGEGGKGLPHYQSPTPEKNKTNIGYYNQAHTYNSHRSTTATFETFNSPAIFVKVGSVNTDTFHVFFLKKKKKKRKRKEMNIQVHIVRRITMHHANMHDTHRCHWPEIWTCMSLSILAIDYALFFKVWRAQWTVSLAYNAKLLVDSKEILRKKKGKEHRRI